MYLLGILCPLSSIFNKQVVEPWIARINHLGLEVLSVCTIAGTISLHSSVHWTLDRINLPLGPTKSRSNSFSVTIGANGL